MPASQQYSDLPDIAFIGRAGAGKSTCAEYLRDNYNYTIRSFAEPIKEIAVRIWGKDAYKDRARHLDLGRTVRAIDEDAWARLQLDDINSLKQLRDLADATGLETRFVIDDCRYPNEYWLLKEAGFVVVRVIASEALRINRLQMNGKLQSIDQLADVSETALDDIEPDHWISNETSNDDVIEQLQRILNKEVARI